MEYNSNSGSTPSEIGSNLCAGMPSSRRLSRTPSLIRNVTTKMSGLYIPKRRYDDQSIHEIDEPESKVEFKNEIISIDDDNEPNAKRHRCGSNDSGIGDDDIIVLNDSTNSNLPNKRAYSYIGLSEERYGPDGVIIGTLLRDFANTDELARRPLGCAYDEVMKLFILADSANDSLRLLRRDSQIGSVVYGEFDYPSAVVVTDPGKYVAVLDERGIKLYDYRNTRFLTLVEHRGGSFDCRGLGITSAGDLVTIKQEDRRKGIMPEIRFYSSSSVNELKNTVLYTREMRENPRHKSFKPCFLDIAPYGRNDRMVITDLGAGTFTLYDLDPKKRKIKVDRQFDCYGRGEGKFKFISGAKFDANCELFISDAEGRTLKYLTRDGKYLQTIEMDQFPYVSNFCINSNNELMACDRRDGRIKLYKLTSRDKLDVVLDNYRY